MDEIKIPEAQTHKEKDLPEILPICALPGVVLGGTAGYYLGATVVAALLGALAGGAVGAAIAYWVLNSSGPVAKDMKNEIKRPE